MSAQDWLKAGAHVTAGARDGYGPVAAKSAMVTSLFADAFADAHPNTYRIFRPFHLYEYSLDGPESVLKGATDEQIKADATYYANRAATLADEALHRVDAIQLINEVGGNDADELRRVVLYEQHAAPVLLARGYRLVALNLAPNSPDWGLPLWKEILAPHIRQLWQAGHIYGRHVYFDIPPYDDNRQRLRWELDYLRALGATGSVAVTELGYVTFPGVDEFMAGVGEWLDSMIAYPELLGTSLFTFGNWWKASITPAAGALAATMQAPDELAVPRQTAQSVNYVVTANLLPQDTTLAEKFVVSFDTYPSKQTILQSADDAAGLVAPGKEGSKVIVYEPARFGGVAVIDAWLKARGVAVVEYRQFNGGNTATDPPTPTPQKVRVGLHMRADPGDIPAADIAEARTLKAGSIKVLDAHSGPSIAKLRAELPNAHFVIRAFLDFGGRFITPHEFFSWTKDNVQRAVSAIGHGNYVVELHNEPNLTPEGLYTSWDGPGGFNSWIKIVLEQYRSLLPGTKFIYPGLSPGWGIGGLRYAHDAWFTQSIATMRLFDGVGVHAYWSNPFPMAQALDHVKLYQQVNRPIYITEASRNDDTVTVAQRAVEYNTFVKECGKIAGAHSVNYFVSSASNPVFWPECWVTENGVSKGIAAAIVGSL